MKQAVIGFDETLLTKGLGCNTREALGLFPGVTSPAFIQDDVAAEPRITPKLHAQRTAAKDRQAQTRRRMQSGPEHTHS